MAKLGGRHQRTAGRREKRTMQGAQLLLCKNIDGDKGVDKIT